MSRFASLYGLFWCAAAFGGELIFPPAVERDAPVSAAYRLNGRATGKGELTIRWTDVYGRVIDDRKIPVQLNDETEIGFTLDARRAVAMKNTLQAHFSFEGVNKKGAPDRRDENTQLTFIARPADRTWWDYNIIMWQNYSADLFAKLKTLGINGSQYIGRNRSLPEFLLNNDLRWYSENIATDFYSEYHRYYPDRVNHWKYLQAKELYKKDPTSKEPFKRHPSFSDAAWTKKVHDRLVDAARFWSPYRPFFYSLGDEPGIADLAAFWDFDFSDESLTEMRGWLKERYGTLAALNRQWGTSFDDWDLVTPETTNEAMKRTDDNFSSWADHKEWMDISYARALKMGADAVRSVDPEAYVGIGGGQMPGWGGYDYYRISQALTAIEPYDIGNNIEILRSLNPKMAVVTTAFAHGRSEKHRVWYELLHGNRGLVLWDDKNEYITKDGSIPPRGQEASPYYNELRGGLGALLVASERQADPIAIHYSQASMRTDWMLTQRPKGDAWARRSSSSERLDNGFLRLRESWCRIIEDLGLQYNFVAYGQVERGELLKRGYRVLVLPRSSSLSDAEAQAIREFVEQGGTLIANGEPGTFDEHSKRLPQSGLGDLFAAPSFGKGRAILLQADVLNYHQNRLVGKEKEVHQLAGKLMRESGVQPEFAVTDQAGNPVVGVETHRFRNGGVTIIGLLTNPQLRVNELGPPEFKSNERFEKPISVRLTLPGELHGWNIRTGQPLGKQKQIAVTLDPFEPAIFAFSAVPIPELTVSAPTRMARGATGRFGLSFGRATPAARHVLHVEVIDPTGKPVPCYSGNLLGPAGHASKALPLALNDAPGTWQVRIRDLLTGQARSASIEVR
jgi:hypothetical protein